MFHAKHESGMMVFAICILNFQLDKGGNTMKVKATIILSVIMFLAILWSSQATSQQAGNLDLKSYYATYIDELVSHCKNKASRHNSKFETIRQTAALYCLKADFLKSHKDTLVEEMAAQNIETKNYKMNYYLNGRFFNELKMAIKKYIDENNEIFVEF